MEAIKVGEQALAFGLKDQQGNNVELESFQGKKVLLSFHPLAWTGVCAEQMKSLEANREELAKLNTVALGLSVDSVPSKKAWGESLGIEQTSLLSDFWPQGELAAKYGIFRDKHGTSERANIIVDEDGRVVFVKIYPISELPDMEEILDFLRK